ncbi:AMP-binding enzyme domain-containing protein [Cladophialophora immunda]|nr:AMP-binding enzyme domain-containing protein [Cladophialophora immunda]
MANENNMFIPRPERFNFTTEVVDQWATEHPQREAMYWVSQDFSIQRSLTFQYFSTQSSRVAVLLKEAGVEQSDVAVVILHKVVAWWEIALACIRSGIILSPSPTLVSESDIRYRCNKSKAKVFIGDQASIRKFLAVRSHCPTVKTIITVGGQSDANILSYYEALKSIPHDVASGSVSLPWDSPALMYFTSGTSGPPKMVIHNQISFPLALGNTGKYWLLLEGGKLFWNTADQGRKKITFGKVLLTKSPGWAKASYSFFGAWNRGASLFIFDDRLPFNANRLLEVLHRFPITTLCAPPLAWRHFVLSEAKAKYLSHPPKALSHCVAAGEALNAEVIRQWKQLSGLSIHDGYGQTETILLCGNFSGCPIRPGSMGKPAPGIPLTIIDANARECAPHEEGNIAVKLSHPSDPCNFFGVFDGYLNEDGSVSRKEQTFSVGGVRQTWYVTGDKAKKDEEGYFWFIGRSDDVINSSGYRIGPFEVESTLKLHPAVAESAVISSPHPERGEVVKAFVVLAADYTRLGEKELESLGKELQTFCRTHAAPYKYPRRIQFVDENFLPKTVSGKIQRNLLRKMEWKDHQLKL